MELEIGPVVLRYVPGPGLDVVVTYRSADAGNKPWKGVASFPWALEDEAMAWPDRIHSENDLEDLLREWAPAETWESFQRLRNELGV